MTLSHLGWLKRTWPLVVSLLAALAIIRVLPRMHSDFEFSRYGIPVPAWYTDLNQDHDVFRYAYVVRDVTYGGQASWDDADSDIYYHKPGDEFRGVEYLSTKPWLSIYRRDPKLELRDTTIWAAFKLCVLAFGVALYRSRVRKGRKLAVLSAYRKSAS